MNPRLLFCLFAICLPAVAAARPAPPPMVRYSTLPGFKGYLPAVRVLPNSQIDVLFWSEDKPWRWDATHDLVSVLLPIGDTAQRWSASGNFLVTKGSGGDISVIDLTNDSEHPTGGYGTPAIHDDRIAWKAGNGVELFDVVSHTRSSFLYPAGANDVRIWEDWIAVTDVNSRLSAIHYPSGLTVGGRTRINSQHDMAFGRLIHASRNALTWAHIGLPDSATTIMLPEDCEEFSDFRLGGSWGQLVVYAADRCRSGTPEIRMVNLDSGVSYFVGTYGSTAAPFDIQGNVLAFVDERGRVNMVIVDESSM